MLYQPSNCKAAYGIGKQSCGRLVDAGHVAQENKSCSLCNILSKSITLRLAIAQECAVERDIAGTSDTYSRAQRRAERSGARENFRVFVVLWVEMFTEFAYQNVLNAYLQAQMYVELCMCHTCVQAVAIVPATSGRLQ